MIKFEIEKLTFGYFNVVKISNDGFVHFINEDGEIKKIQGMKNFYMDVNKKLGFSTFPEPKKMAILFYDNYPLCLDYQVLKLSDVKMRRELSENWQTSLPKFIEAVQKNITEGVNKEQDAYVDGKYLYFLKHEEKEIELDGEKKKEKEIKRVNTISNDGSFKLVTCTSINLQSPFIYLGKKETQKSYRKVIVYNVTKKDGTVLECISPTIPNIKYKNKDTGQVDFDKMNDYFMVNLNFVLDAAKIVGERYGYEATEFLDLEEILLDMNTVNLYQIEDHIRNLTPANISLMESMAWLLGFCYKEKNITEMVKFRSLFAKLFDVYLTSRDQIEKLNVKIEDLSKKRIKIKTFSDLENEYEIYQQSAQKMQIMNTENYLF